MDNINGIILTPLQKAKKKYNDPEYKLQINKIVKIIIIIN